MNSKRILHKILIKISPSYRRLILSVEPKIKSLESKIESVDSKIDLLAERIGQMEKELIYKDELFAKKRDVETKIKFSHLNEEDTIKKYLNSLKTENKYCVDIAASDGITMSNTLFLFRKGWSGLAVEVDSKMFSELSFLYKDFSNVNLIKTKVVPENVVSILKAADCPRNFAFLNFDIDSYDYFVLEKILGEFRPSLMCVEINEKIPPPIEFTVKYDPSHVWQTDHFFGQSISKCSKLCKMFNYEIVELYYNNLFLIPKEKNKFPALSPEKAYETGYKEKPDRKEKFPWNLDMEELLTMPKDKGMKFLEKKFKNYAGKFILE
jgi:hypothetical protein